MKCPRSNVLLGALAALLFPGATASGSAADALAWPPLTSQTRPWVWWWWPGSAVDPTNLFRQLQLFHAAGLGGVQIIPIYGAKGWESHYIRYLSPEWMKMMGDTVADARRLDLGVDMTLGTGWCFGGPTVSDHDANARVVVKTFDLAAGEKLTEKFDRQTLQALVAFSPRGKTVDLTGEIARDGSVNWTAPAGAWRIYAVSQAPSGQKVKRAAPGGEGWMLNPLYPRAMRDWLHWFDRAFDHYTGPKPRAVFQDSYEYRTDWAPDFLAQFEKLRGYRLQAVLPAIFGEQQEEEAARIKSDYRRTVSDIMAEESEPVWIAWAHRHGFATTYQAHGTPGNWLDLYADADMPETEMFHLDRNPLVSKFASSAAHVAGHALVGAETGTWLAEHFTVTLGELKQLADDMFLSGVNHVYYHGCCYSPEAAPWPGWLFYAATEMNPRNSIWRDVPALNAYVARCQSILQSGRPDNDLLLYWPISDFWNNPRGLLQPMTVGQISWFDDQPIGAAARKLWDRGYAFDYVSDRQLQSARTKTNEIEMPGGHYQVIVAPECNLMPLGTLRKLLSLAEDGATVIFQNHLPADVPGWGNLAKRRSAFDGLIHALSADAVASAGGSAITIGQGRVLVGNLENQLAFARCRPEGMTAEGLRFVRRSFAGGWHYFIVNRNAKGFDGWVTLARPANSVAILDPMTGHAGVAAARQTHDQTAVYLQLPAGGSLILRAFAAQKVSGPAWPYWQTHGRPAAVTGDWHVRFVQGGPVLPAPFQTSALASWTQLGDTNAQRFAGTARYEVTFVAPDSASGKNYILDLGKVCQSARIRLNGRDYGTLIAPPFQVAVDNVKPAGNRIEVEVTNVSANRIRDLDRRHVPWKYFHDINFVDINYRPFDASDWPLTDSGLLGPVTLTAVSPFRP
ncbi:MAG: hypothetical protein KGJ60_14130 [Verrucomicrobiota bacterium]|nr:hypothetical protein [Verrucomicrobiota bacterium]